VILSSRLHHWLPPPQRYPYMRDGVRSLYLQQNIVNRVKVTCKPADTPLKSLRLLQRGGRGSLVASIHRIADKRSSRRPLAQNQGHTRTRASSSQTSLALVGPGYGVCPIVLQCDVPAEPGAVLTSQGVLFARRFEARSNQIQIFPLGPLIFSRIAERRPSRKTVGKPVRAS